MLRNSFKFLSLALAASLTVAPVSAIDWNSNSSRWGLAGLAVVTVGLVCVVAYNYFSGRNTPKQEINSVTSVAKENTVVNPVVGNLVKENATFEEKEENADVDNQNILSRESVIEEKSKLKQPFICSNVEILENASNVIFNKSRYASEEQMKKDAEDMRNKQAEIDAKKTVNRIESEKRKIATETAKFKADRAKREAEKAQKAAEEAKKEEARKKEEEARKSKFSASIKAANNKYNNQTKVN